MSQESMRTDLRTYILADTDITDIVGTKVYAAAAPPGAKMPRIVMTVVAVDLPYSHQGDVDGETTRMQFDLIAENISALAALRDALISRLSGYVGSTGATQFSGIFKTDTDFEDFDDTAGVSGESIEFRKVIDFSIQWQSLATV